ncbi:chaperone NapD [Brenneria corticis]|uniref:Chaperone NapD n=1 Tax=Brenneria corticis TaxID=2173106 RepID=A0A2U1U463_9GAMM|nr:chaperone NapD [Brenneria sp. CFCC 11842]PWC16451.1 nitrate reductase [Brenneria sp. CFCC 11842]
MSTSWHVCSLVVRAHPYRLAALSEALSSLPGCEVAAGDGAAGKLAVVLEADSEASLLKLMASVRDLSGVLAVSLVYHQLDAQNQGEETS